MNVWRLSWSCLGVCDRRSFFSSILFVSFLIVFVCVLCVLLVLLVLFAMFDGVCCYVYRFVMYAWRVYWSRLGVCDRCLFCPLHVFVRAGILLILFVLCAMIDG